MVAQELWITYIGGPTALIEIGGFRLLTDPTFDPAGGVYGNLAKTRGPVLEPDALGRVDAVLLSHDHHDDNLDHRGREFLKNAGRVLTTVDGAKRLGGNAFGLAPWESAEFRVDSVDGSTLKITATPARHGPAHMDRGPVVGFVLKVADSEQVIYVSCDTVWYEGVAEVAKKYKVEVAILFMGAARVAQVGPWALTMTAEDGVAAARAFAEATIVPLHYEGWKHFSESRADVEKSFAEAGLQHRLKWLEAGQRVAVRP
jgi:L-ascorbate metabolism protein UlaG (beta-lactamase superfamily)